MKPKILKPRGMLAAAQLAYVFSAVRFVSLFCVPVLLPSLKKQVLSEYKVQANRLGIQF